MWVYLATAGFGAVLILIVLAATLVRTTPFDDTQQPVIRVALALGCACVAVLLPGTANIKMGNADTEVGKAASEFAGPMAFFFLVFITIDEYTTKDVRSSAQNVFNLIIFGVGVILGNWLSGQLGAWSTDPATKAVDWQQFYAVPGYITLACLLVLLVMYPNRPRSKVD